MCKIFFLALIMFIFSCETNNYLFENVNFTEGKSFICILPLKTSDTFKSIDPIFEKAIFIDDINALQKIRDLWKTNKSNFKGIPKYNLQAFNDGKMICNFIFNENMNKVITVHGEFNFDPKKLIVFKEYFKPLMATKIKIRNIYQARKFKNIIDNNKGYVPTLGTQSHYNWEKYLGMTVLKRKSFNLPIEIKSQFENIIINEFSKNDSIILGKIILDSNSDNWIIEIISRNEIKIPNNYEVEENFKNFTNISFYIIGVDSNKIERLASTNNITLDECSQERL